MSDDVTTVVPVQPVTTADGDRIFQRMTEKRRSLADVGLVKVTFTYLDDGIMHTRVALIQHDTLDKITNTLEDEQVG